MIRVFSLCGATALLFAAAGDRPDLTGEWELDAARSRDSDLKTAAVTIEQTAEAIRIRQTNGADMKCGTMGQECTFMDAGRPVRATVWHNGPSLVIMETRGKNRDIVTRKRLSLGKDGSTLTMEIFHITPPEEKAETLVFVKKR